VKSRVIAKPRKRVPPILTDASNNLNPPHCHRPYNPPLRNVHQDLVLLSSILVFHPRMSRILRPKRSRSREQSNTHHTKHNVRNSAHSYPRVKAHDRTHQTQTPPALEIRPKKQAKALQKCHLNSTHPAPPRPPHPYQKVKVVDDLRAAQINRNLHHPVSRKVNPHLPRT
jgi:hypothetical protein